MAEDWLTEYEARKADEQEQAREKIRRGCEVLERLGVAKVTVAYDGVGDSGSGEGVTFDPDPAAGIPEGLTNLIEDAAYAFLPGGWEINEGSFGTLEIDVRGRKLNRDHNW